MKFQVKDYIHLNKKNIWIKRNRKLKWKQFKSFKILEKIKNQIYKSNLFKRWQIYNIFYVLLLKKDLKRRKKVFITKFTYTLKDIKVKQNYDDQEYFVNEIVDFKIFKKS